jgi:hypothetical protein
MAKRCRRTLSVIVGLACATAACLLAPARAIEGSTTAGPVGGNDIRSALLPPPGVYAGVVGLIVPVHEIHDGSGNPAPGLDAVDLLGKVVGPFLFFVPDVTMLGGSFGVLASLSYGQECGQIVSYVPSRCSTGFGDPYFEVEWSRNFGHWRPSRYPGALPIMEGLAVKLGLGAVLPIGKYDRILQATNGVSIGNNTFDVAPSIAFTYTTPPLLAEGTEFSAKLYWNNYRTNPDTQYHAGSLLDVNFAVSEHIGRFQVGAAGFYAAQVEDDTKFGVRVPPDGRRVELLELGGVLNYDMPEIGAAIRVKALTAVYARNVIVSRSIAIGFAKKLN